MKRRAAFVFVTFGVAIATALAGVRLGEDVSAPHSVHAAGPPSLRASVPSARATPQPATSSQNATGTEPATSPQPATNPEPAARSFTALETEVAQVLDSAGVAGGVTLIELSSGQSWSLNGDQSFVAASTYKLPVLMKDAEDIAAGRASPNDALCYDPGDWEDGYFYDYEAGTCFTRGELDRRAGIYSDNTAAHILVRYEGGPGALNAYVRAHGATESAFYDPNSTTSNDLARLWQAEAQGWAGGAAAQAYLYPLLTHTEYEDGIPAGLPSGETVVHKVGFLDGVLNDAALVEGGPRGSYVLAVVTDGGSWQLIADVAQVVAQFEAS